MPKSSTNRAPVETLNEQLAGAAASGAEQLKEYVESLGVKIADFSADIDQLLEDYPKAAVISAFLLGVAIGRASKR